MWASQIAPVRTSGPGTEELRQKEVRSLLRDFRTDSRMLVLVALAIPVGAVAAVVAKALLWLITELTNLVFFQRLGSYCHRFRIIISAPG